MKTWRDGDDPFASDEALLYRLVLCWSLHCEVLCWTVVIVGVQAGGIEAVLVKKYSLPGSQPVLNACVCPIFLLPMTSYHFNPSLLLSPHPHTHSKTRGFEREERLVYQIIEDSSNKGIWTRDIRNSSNLGPAHVTKILKTLESKKLIKLVKSVQASKKKVYMLYDLTPDVSLTGGAWYSDQEFESEFVEVLNHHCLRFLEQKVCGGMWVGVCVRWEGVEMLGVQISMEIERLKSKTFGSFVKRCS